MRKRNKYGAIKTTVDGITFDSKAEAKRYWELKILQNAGEIQKLELQPRFDCKVNGKHVTTYVADFAYFTDACRVYEDVKGVRTREYIIKKKLVEAIFNVEITEVK